MKKFMALLLTLALVCVSLPSAFAQQEKLSIVCTTFPQYDWVRQIVGNASDNVELTLLLDNGVDLHSYQPTAADNAKISTADLFIYVGGESDVWVEDALKNATNPKLIAVNLLTVLGSSVKEEEVVEGMQAEEDAEEEDGVDYDEHVWLSVKNAAVLVDAIAEQLCSISPENRETFTANADAYMEQLNALDAQYQSMVDAAARHTILFADRFPFRYLADDYGLDYYAAFVGCSAESEASFATIAFLSQKVDELSLPVVLVIEGKDHAIADTVIANTTSKGQKIVVMNSIQSVTADEIAAGLNYLSIMSDNLTALTQALN